MTPKTALLWFRNDLRVEDHPVLAGLPSDLAYLLPVYIIDPRLWQPDLLTQIPKAGPHRLQFLLESLEDLKRNLQSLGSDLLIRVGHPEEVIPALAEVWDPEVIFFEREIAPEEREVEVRLMDQVKSRWFIKTYFTKSLIHPLDLPFSITALPDVFTLFRKKVESRFPVRSLLPFPNTLPPPPSIFPFGDVPALSELIGSEPPVPHPQSAFPFKGGSSSGALRLNDFIWERQLLSTYKTTRNGLLGEAYSSKLSAWLSLGCISPRKVYDEVRRFEQMHGATEETYWLIFELLWRDYFRFVMMRYGAALFQKGGIQQKSLSQKFDQALFEQWKRGETGDAFIDAFMRELWHTGFMSNRGRQNVASYLVHHLGVDWRWGAAWFEYALIDYDVCSNWGNWAYVAGVGNDPRPNRIFQPERQSGMYDPNGDFQRCWAAYPVS